MFGPSSTIGDASITPTEYADVSPRSPFVYRARLALARTLAAVRLHRLDTVQDTPAHWQRKRRTELARILLRPGNAYLRAQGMAVRVLPRAEWLCWERQVAQALGREARISPDGAALETPFIPGNTLAEILRGSLPLEDKLSALRTAAGALKLLHSKAIHHADGEAWGLSHGDATCHNVVVNLSTSSAEWIDFDMRHEWLCPVIERHADDLRALVFSSAACLPSALHATSAEQTVGGYGEPQVVRQLQKSLEKPRGPTVFQLAQAPMSCTEYFRLCRWLQWGFSALSA
jgi:tRNA A-37 threonylcarbamoyl transferase component Bud32